MTRDDAKEVLDDARVCAEHRFAGFMVDFPGGPPPEVVAERLRLIFIAGYCAAVVDIANEART